MGDSEALLGGGTGPGLGERLQLSSLNLNQEFSGISLNCARVAKPWKRKPLTVKFQRSKHNVELCRAFYSNQNCAVIWFGLNCKCFRLHIMECWLVPGHWTQTQAQCMWGKLIQSWNQPWSRVYCRTHWRIQGGPGGPPPPQPPRFFQNHAVFGQL